ncbi:MULTISPECIES: glycogen debranching protein GlgX [Arthrobacter]|uniref:Glycogen debranching enzyme GlgX n=1 Tax=Arthrobacter terricola TaxID=2547396 RepID=A0A4V2ZRN8_9MICC|nr:MULTISPECIES: glycogen debranching protein GlgX [Arthrobacter]MBT8163120.1 glycogen debranching protein GlgX [Arthrobacter sp. GN70]TDF87894.1 glycogen debranching enzyme GlgX [Arthrobacter terricola]
MVMPIFDTASTTDASRPSPLGLSLPQPASSDAEASSPERVNVAVWAPGLSTVEIAYKAPGESWKVQTLPKCDDGVHHGLVENLPAGTRYGFRGAPHEEALPLSVPAPDFDSDDVGQLLLDPYGRAVHQRGEHLSSVRMESAFDWGDDKQPRTPWRETIVYEAHVRGQSMLHPDIPEHLRGTYAGMAHPAMIEHFHSLGVTAVQLLPVHFHMDEQHLQYLGLTNYWGYNTAAFFAPHADYATQAAQQAGPHAVQDEFKGMVKLLHAAGIEVILDVVYNHTAEGGPDGDTFSFRGLGEQQYYRHDAHGRYLDTTGCGNTLNFAEPRIVDLAIDSLRYWVDEFHIDGFRFDLAVTLCRNAGNEFDLGHPFLKRIAEDPVLSKSKLISEPWDVGYGGWQTGRFPKGWADWNDHFRDGVRRFWLSDRSGVEPGQSSGVGALADALTGSARVFGPSGRSRLASLNFVTAHDGFTLADLVSYDRKHNEANGEQNRDGHSDNRSYNHGFEGRTENETILAARALSKRNLMTTLMISIGVPMITAGDELGRTQHGNNNAYCQDNQLTWLDWTQTPESHDMLRSTKRVIRLRKEFLQAQDPGFPDSRTDLDWFDEKGQPMTAAKWNDPSVRILQLLASSEGGAFRGLLVINGHKDDKKIVLPKLIAESGAGHRMFELRLTTSELNDRRQGALVAAGEREIVQGNTINIYRT